jgi:hypothetical protein
VMNSHDGDIGGIFEMLAENCLSNCCSNSAGIAKA